MPEFTDGEGRKWHPHFTMGLAKELKRKLNINVFAWEGADALADPDKLMGAIFLSIRDEAKEAEVTLADLEHAMDAGPLMPMIEALNQAIAIFMTGKAEVPKPKEGEEEPRPTPETPGE